MPGRLPEYPGGGSRQGRDEDFGPFSGTRAPGLARVQLRSEARPGPASGLASRGRREASSRRVAFAASPGRGGGRVPRRAMARAGQPTPHAPPPARAGSRGPHPAGSPRGAGTWPSPNNARPAPARPPTGSRPQHGLAGLAGARAVGPRLRAAAPRLRPGPDPPQLPSAAGPPRPAHDAQPAAALPNRVSAPARPGGSAAGGDREAGTGDGHPRSGADWGGEVPVRGEASGDRLRKPLSSRD